MKRSCENLLTVLGRLNFSVNLPQKSRTIVLLLLVCRKNRKKLKTTNFNNTTMSILATPNNVHFGCYDYHHYFHDYYVHFGCYCSHFGYYYLQFDYGCFHFGCYYFQYYRYLNLKAKKIR